MGDQRTMVVIKKEGYVTCDIASTYQCVGLSHPRLTVCGSVDHLLVCRSSPFGECDGLRISPKT
jgi:hypothetical protein